MVVTSSVGGLSTLGLISGLLDFDVCSILSTLDLRSPEKMKSCCMRRLSKAMSEHETRVTLQHILGCVTQSISLEGL